MGLNLSNIYQESDEITMKKLDILCNSDIYLKKQQNKYTIFKVIYRSSPIRETIVQNELNALQTLNHPNIIKLLKHEVFENRYELEFPYYEEGDLFEYIKIKDHLSEIDTKSLFKPICEALQYVHSKGFVHRDLKLDNIFLKRIQDKLIPFIGDWGYSTEADDKTLLSNKCGSLIYAAPEIFVRNLKYLGRPVDIWSLGIIVYMLLTGHAPFYDDSGIIDAQLKKDYYVPSSLSKEAIELINQILEPSPSRRISIDQILNSKFLTVTQNDQESVIL